MQYFRNALMALCMGAFCAGQVSAAPPLPKVSSQGAFPHVVAPVKPRVAGAESRDMLSFRIRRQADDPFNRGVDVAPPMRAGSKSYTSDVEVPNLFGWVNYSADWATELIPPSGVYNMPVSSAGQYSLRFLNPNSVKAGVVKDGIYYCCYTMTVSFSGTPYVFVYYEGYDLDNVDPQNASCVRLSLIHI